MENIVYFKCVQRVGNIGLVLYNGASRIHVIGDIKVKLYIPSVCWNQNLGDANLCQNSGFMLAFI